MGISNPFVSREKCFTPMVIVLEGFAGYKPSIVAAAQASQKKTAAKPAVPKTKAKADKGGKW